MSFDCCKKKFKYLVYDYQVCEINEICTSFKFALYNYLLNNKYYLQLLNERILRCRSLEIVSITLELQRPEAIMIAWF